MKILTFILLFFTLIGCGKSPLLKEIKPVSGIDKISSAIKFKTTNQYLQVNFLTELDTFSDKSAVIIFNKNGKIYDPRDLIVNARLWMKSMGHGSSPIKITKISDGIFLLEEITFIMPGEWQLHIELRDQFNHLIEDQEIALTIFE